MKKLETNKKQKFYSFLIGAVMMITALFVPATAVLSLIDNNVLASDAYTKTTKVTVENSGFESTNSDLTPKNWSNNIPTDSSASIISGVMDTTLTNWETDYNKLVSQWVSSWKENNGSMVGVDNIANALELYLKQNPQFVNPLTADHDLKSTQDNKVLVVSAGNNFTTYSSDPDELVSTPNSGYYKYTSKAVSLSGYSYYRISVYVKTSDDAVANITVTGDVEVSKSNIETASNTVTYYQYLWTDSATSSTATLYSTDYITSPIVDDIITVDGIQYKFNGTSFVADTASANYQDSYAGYSVAYNSKSFLTGKVSDWTKYELYVATRESASVSLELGIGTKDTASSGTAFFDDILIEQIQYMDYENAVTSHNPDTALVHSERKNVNVFASFENADTNSDSKLDMFDAGFSFVSGGSGTAGFTNIFADEETITGIEPTFKGVSTSVNTVLKVTNSNSTAVRIKTPEVEIKQLKYYRVSYWVRTDNDTSYLATKASVTTYMTSKLSDGKDVNVKATTLPYMAKEDSKGEVVQNVNNYWKEVSFYVLACPIYDTTAWLEIDITTPCTLLFDNFTIEEVSVSDYTKSKGTKLALNTSIPKETVSNGYFTLYDNVDFDDFNSPLPASNWTIESSLKKDVYLYYANTESAPKNYTVIADNTTISFSGDDLVYNAETYTKEAQNANAYICGTQKIEEIKGVEFTYDRNKKAYYNSKYDATVDASYISSGIVPTSSDTIFANYADDLNSATNPNAGSTAKENVLAIYSGSDTSFGYSSKAFTLASSKVYRISVTVWSSSENASIVLKSGNKVYAEVNNVNTNSQWKTYMFYVYTGTQNPSVQLSLKLDGTGNVYFKNISHDSSSSTTAFNNRLKEDSVSLKAEDVVVVDLSSETFAERSNEINTNTNLFDALLYSAQTISGTTTGTWGILDTENADPAYDAIKAMENSKSPYVLILKNGTSQSTKIKSEKALVLTKTSYFKITINAKTIDVDKSKFATISFDNIEVSFNINTADFTDSATNNYKTYTLYVATGDSSITLNPTISLIGAEGTLAVDSIVLEKSSKSVFDGLSEDTADQVIVNLTTPEEEAETETETEETEEPTKTNNTLEIFFVVLSSIILVVAIIIAVVFSGTKRLPSKKREQIDTKFELDEEDDEKGFV